MARTNPCKSGTSKMRAPPESFSMLSPSPPAPFPHTIVPSPKHEFTKQKKKGKRELKSRPNKDAQRPGHARALTCAHRDDQGPLLTPVPIPCAIGKEEGHTGLAPWGSPRSRLPGRGRGTPAVVRRGSLAAWLNACKCMPPPALDLLSYALAFWCRVYSLSSLLSRQPCN